MDKQSLPLVLVTTLYSTINTIFKIFEGFQPFLNVFIEVQIWIYDSYLSSEAITETCLRSD